MKGKKWLALSLITVLFLSGSTGVLAAESTAGEKETSETVTVQETLTQAQEIPTSGKCGDNLTWRLDRSKGVLTISGTGDMWNWGNGSAAPWIDRNVSPHSGFSTVVIEKGVTSIGDYAFYNSAVASVTIPDTVKTIGTASFHWCQYLRSVNIPNSVTTVKKNAFSSCQQMTTLTLGNSVKTIEDGAFGYCFKLQSVTIPDSVTQMGQETFYQCQELQSVTLSRSLTSLRKGMFSGSGITGISIPTSVKSIEAEAFDSCHYLTSVNIPSSVTTIEGGAFHHCSRLTNVVMTDSVTSIGDRSFEECKSLTSVTMSKSVKTLETAVFSGCEKLTDITLPDGVVSIGANAFSGCGSLKKLNIPSSLTTLGADAFNGCKSLTSIKLPGGLKKIPKDAFLDCASLTAVTVPSGVTSIGDYAFAGCKKLETVNIPKSVTSIGSYAFADCRRLSGATLHDSITEIREGTFYGCSAMKSITIPSSVSSIRNDAFQNCRSLNNVNIPSTVTYIGTYSFAGCTGLTDVAWSSSLKGIPEGTFAGCVSLRKFTIPSGTTTIGEGAFYNCYALSSIRFPTSCTQIKGYAFSKCKALIQLTFPSAMSVGEESFSECSALQSITIQTKRGFSAGRKAFSKCPDLKDVYYGGTKSDWTDYFKTVKLSEKSWGLQNDPVIHYKSSAPTIQSVAIAAKPSKLIYAYGESFSSDGLKLKVTYSDGSKKEVTSGFTYAPYSFKASGQQTVTVYYDGKSVNFTVTVNQPVLTSVVIKKKPSKLTYAAGERFNPDGMILKTTYSDQSVKEITQGFTCTPSGPLTTVGQQKIVVQFGGKSTGFYVTVSKAANSTVTSVVIKKKPTQLDYDIGNTLNSQGMKLKVTYSDGSTEEITEGFTCTPGKLNTAGQQKIVVGYKGKTTGFYVTVHQAASIAIRKKPSKMIYMAGEKFDPSGMTLKVTYPDGTTKEVSEGFTCTPETLTKGGQQKIVVSYGGKTTGIYVTVHESKPIASIAVKTKPAKLTYRYLEKFDSSGMTLQVTYTDNSTEIVKDSFTCAFVHTLRYNDGTVKEEWNDFTDQPFSLFTAGQQKIIVQYRGKYTELYVTVTKSLRTLRVQNPPKKQHYLVGETLDLTGLQVKADYENAPNEVLTSGFTCTPSGKLDTVGEQRIIISYGGQTAGFVITVKQISSVAIQKLPVKRTYTAGETFDPTGMTMKITYSDGTAEVISQGFTCTPSGKLDTVGQQKIVVSYKGKSTGFYVNVES